MQRFFVEEPPWMEQYHSLIEEHSKSRPLHSPPNQKLVHPNSPTFVAFDAIRVSPYRQNPSAFPS